MREKRRRLQEALLFLGAAVLFGAMVWLLWAYVPRREVRYGLLGLCAGLFLLAALWRAWVSMKWLCPSADFVLNFIFGSCFWILIDFCARIC